jgi:exopolysaccharide biosynthesis polyprenyl glycosylphosphotransferase
MFFDRERGFQAAQALGDGLIAAFSLVAATAILAGGSPWGWAALDPTFGSGEFYRHGALAAMLTPFALRCSGAYALHRRPPLRGVFPILLQGTVIGTVFLLAASFAFSTRCLSISVLGLYAAVQLAMLTAQRATGIMLPYQLWVRGYNAGTFVVIGSGPRARRVAQELAADPVRGMRNRGFLDDTPRPRDLEVLGHRYLGRTKDLSGLLSNEAIDEVILALPRQYMYTESTAELIALCESVGVDVTIASDLFQTRRARPQLRDLLGGPAITLTNYPHRTLGALAVKRAIDIVGAVIGIVIAAPLWLIAMLAIKLDSPGPVFFVQRRCGLRGRTFSFIKFRTMYQGAEEQLEELLERNEVSGPVFKMKKDPRVTRVGHFLRKYSIDELPQFLNVLLGHMSLVGPRPPVPGEVGQYDLAVRRRLSVRPGLTCLWQVSGRSLIPFEEWIRLDLEYIDGWSLWLDFQILLLTIPAVLRGDGAS